MPATVGSFRGIKLTPGKPHSLRLAKGELYSLRQLALAKPGTKATVSLRTAGNPEVVVCALDVSAAQWTLELEVGAADEAVLVCKGSDVDVSGAVSLDDERPAASSVSAKRAAAAPFPPSKKARTQPEPGDEEDDGEDDGEDEDEEDEDEDEEDEDEDEEEGEDEPDKPRGGLIDDRNGLGPYPQLASAELGLGLSCDVGSAAIVGFDKTKDPRERRHAKRDKLAKVDPLLAQWEQQVTAVHVADQLV